MNTLEDVLKKLQAPEISWAARALLVEEFHELAQRIHGVAQVGPGKTGWGVRDTATAIGLSKSAVSLDIQLARTLHHDPSLASYTRRYVAAQLRTKDEE